MNELIYQILSGDTALCAMLGKICTADKSETEIPAVFYGNPGSWDKLPCIAFLQTDCHDEAFADDQCYAKLYTYEFDVFAKGSTDMVYKRMDTLLREKGFFCKSYSEILEPDCRHKHCTYTILKEEEI